MSCTHNDLLTGLWLVEWYKELGSVHRYRCIEAHLGIVHELVQELLVFQPGHSLLLIQLRGRVHTLHSKASCHLEEASSASTFHHYKTISPLTRLHVDIKLLQMMHCHLQPSAWTCHDMGNQA